MAAVFIGLLEHSAVRPFQPLSAILLQRLPSGLSLIFELCCMQFATCTYAVAAAGCFCFHQA